MHLDAWTIFSQHRPRSGPKQLQVDLPKCRVVTESSPVVLELTMAEGDSKGYLFLMRRLLLALLTFFFSLGPRVSLFPQLGIFSGLRVDLRIYNYWL